MSVNIYWNHLHVEYNTLKGTFETYVKRKDFLSKMILEQDAIPFKFAFSVELFFLLAPKLLFT